MKFVKVAQTHPNVATAPRLPPPPPNGEASLVTDPTQRETLTARRDTDARTALSRALKEYIQQLMIIDAGGAELRFKEVFEVWAEPETVAVFPSAAIFGGGRGNYDAARFTPGLNPNEILPAQDGRYVVKPCEYTGEYLIDVWTDSPGSRMMLAAMLEEQLSPAEWMYGVRLTVPYYHGVHAEFEPLSSEYLDSEDASAKRWRRVQFIVTGRIPVIRLVALSLDQPTVRLTVADGAEEEVHPPA